MSISAGCNSLTLPPVVQRIPLGKSYDPLCKSDPRIPALSPARSSIVCILPTSRIWARNWDSSPSLNCQRGTVIANGPAYCAGISVNMSAFAATFLAEAAYDPRILLPYSSMGEGHELVSPSLSYHNNNCCCKHDFTSVKLTSRRETKEDELLVVAFLLVELGPNLIVPPMTAVLIWYILQTCLCSGCEFVLYKSLESRYKTTHWPFQWVRQLSRI